MTEDNGREDFPKDKKANRNFIYFLFLSGFISLLIGILMLSDSIQRNEKFTEFYILDEKRQASFDTFQPGPGETIEIYIGIVNHERETANYRVLIQSGSELIKSYGPIRLNDNQAYEEKVEFLWPRNRLSEVEILLDRENAVFPYRTLQMKYR